MRRWLERVWYRPDPPPWFLRILVKPYIGIASLVGAQQRAHANRLPVPVVVIGNISVGGTGKTPCVQWLTGCLRELGWHPGIVSRGYGGQGPFPRQVDPDSNPALCGDEPVMLARTTQAPVVVAPDRVAAAYFLMARDPNVDIILTDDGLQHYRLARDLEFCIIDGRRGYGNGWRIPAGPLREAVDRAELATLLWVNGASADPYGEKAIRFDLRITHAVNIVTGERRNLSQFANCGTFYAFAGIGHPQRFFDALRAQGLQPETRVFPDHHVFRCGDFKGTGETPVLMTEKDAVKCSRFKRENLWSVPVQVEMKPAASERVKKCLATLRKLDGSKP